MLRPIFFIALLCLLVIYWRQPADNDTQTSTKKSTTKAPSKAATHGRKAPAQPSRNSIGRTVAVGDLHSDLDQTLAVLRLAGVVDEDDNWSGGRDTLVQTVKQRTTKILIYATLFLSSLFAPHDGFCFFLTQQWFTWVLSRSLFRNSPRVILWIEVLIRLPSTTSLINCAIRPKKQVDRYVFVA